MAMNKMKIAKSTITALIALMLSAQAQAVRTGYNVQENILTLPSVELEGVRFNFPKVRILSIEVLDTGIISEVPAGFSVCSSSGDFLTQSKLDAIQIGMTLNQVNQVLGCLYNPPTQSLQDNCVGCAEYSYEKFSWGSVLHNYITVNIDNTTHLVVHKSGIIR